ncbi:MAG: hypothetical protein KF770_15725 [Anaerolineae bacterium]|nr:hypothetical protein [Anaerolineae bacterium]
MNESQKDAAKNDNGAPPVVEIEGAGQAGLVSRRRQLAQMRRILVVGLGGSGQITVTCLKAQLQTSFGDDWHGRIRLLAFDTTEESFAVQGPDGLVSLEAGVEFFDIGNIPVGSIARNLESQMAIKERLGAIISQQPTAVLRNGSKQLRPFGLLALLWRHGAVNEQLRQALWRLAGRDPNDALNEQQGINVFVVGSLGGGTGSGTLFDTTYLIRDAFTDLGAQAEFCHITGIGVLPQAFPGVKAPNMQPNTAAALQELNHLMTKGQFQTRYPDGRTVISREAPFDLFYVVDGVDESGRAWPDVYAVCAMAAHCIYLQMGTQLGQKGENAFDNLDEILIGRTADGQGTFLGSFGKGDLTFDAPAVAGLCARWLLLEWCRQVWLSPPDTAAALGQTEPLCASLKTERLRPLLNQDPETGAAVAIDLTQPGWLARKPVADIPVEAARYVAEYGQARVAEKMLPLIGRNGQTIAATIQQQWAAWLPTMLFAPSTSLNTATAALHQLQEWLAAQMKAAQAALAEQERQQARREQAFVQAETAVSKAAASFPIGRSGRLRDALAHYFRVAQHSHDGQLQLHIGRAELSVWYTLHSWVRTQGAEVTALRERLASLASLVETEAVRQAHKVSRGGIAAISLADTNYVQTLYGRYKPTDVHMKERLDDPTALRNLDRDALGQQLLTALRIHFAPIAAMTVEDVIRERRDEMSPIARRQQLFQLATPSWNIDRARLPEGGANLVRLEVLGVPDATNSLFAGEPMLVSTYDPHRLTALVVAAGAPPSALQQYDHYMQALAQARGKRPLHILPEFMMTGNQGRLCFALGSIFGLIYNQGAHFYYQPADPLQPPFRLANGLSNALHLFSEREELVTEVNERVEGQIARMGLQQAITILTDYYANGTNSNTPLDEQLRELKRLVRDYTEGLRRIDAFSAGIHEEVIGNR